MKNFKKIFLVILLLIIFIVFSSISYASNVFKDLSSKVFRLHIIANSNTQLDQSLKLKIRDNIISYLEKICANCKSKDEYISLINNNLLDLKSIAKKTIQEDNLDYVVNLKIGNFYFPTKYYGNISFPAGFYDGLKIEIGEATGENWWCSLFPPLCFTDISSGIVDDTAEEILKDNISTEEFNIISSNNETYRIKFKLIEFLNEKNIL